jgi:uncharacterized ferritin-like protein (DUF455 family)
MPTPEPPFVTRLRVGAGEALLLDDLDAKTAAVSALAERAGEAVDDDDGGGSAGGEGGVGAVVVLDVRFPGRPARPELVEPNQLVARRLTSVEGRIAAVHAVTHIEANAINLALDAVHRFPNFPPAYYLDWLGVATEEADHFLMLRDRLRALGADYGDVVAHDGLWDMAVRTADDPLRRMALVPRVLEARGLDVTPGMIRRFEGAGDHETADALRTILTDEVGHVAVGSRWFAWLCAARGLDADATFAALLSSEGVRIQPPLNTDARLAAGFSPDLLTALSSPTSS